MFEMTHIQTQLGDDTPVTGRCSEEFKSIGATFGFLMVGPVTFYLPGRNGEVGQAARKLAAKLNDVLLSIAQEADKKEEDRQAALAAAALDPVPVAIPSSEVPH